MNSQVSGPTRNSGPLLLKEERTRKLLALWTIFYPNVPAIVIQALTAEEESFYGFQRKRVTAFFSDMVENIPQRTMVQAVARTNITAYSYSLNIPPVGLCAAIDATHYQEAA